MPVEERRPSGRRGSGRIRSGREGGQGVLPPAGRKHLPPLQDGGGGSASPHPGYQPPRPHSMMEGPVVPMVTLGPPKSITPEPDFSHLRRLHSTNRRLQRLHDPGPSIMEQNRRALGELRSKGLLPKGLRKANGEWLVSGLGPGQIDITGPAPLKGPGGGGAPPDVPESSSELDRVVVGASSKSQLKEWMQSFTTERSSWSSLALHGELVLREVREQTKDIGAPNTVRTRAAVELLDAVAARDTGYGPLLRLIREELVLSIYFDPPVGETAGGVRPAPPPAPSRMATIAEGAGAGAGAGGLGALLGGNLGGDGVGDEADDADNTQVKAETPAPVPDDGTGTGGEEGAGAAEGGGGGRLYIPGVRDVRPRSSLHDVDAKWSVPPPVGDGGGHSAGGGDGAGGAEHGEGGGGGGGSGFSSSAATGGGPRPVPFYEALDLLKRRLDTESARVESLRSRLENAAVSGEAQAAAAAAAFDIGVQTLRYVFRAWRTMLSEREAKAAKVAAFVFRMRNQRLAQAFQLWQASAKEQRETNHKLRMLMDRWRRGSLVTCFQLWRSSVQHSKKEAAAAEVERLMAELDNAVRAKWELEQANAELDGEKQKLSEEMHSLPEQLERGKTARSALERSTQLMAGQLSARVGRLYARSGVVWLNPSVAHVLLPPVAHRSQAKGGESGEGKVGVPYFAVVSGPEGLRKAVRGWSEAEEATAECSGEAVYTAFETDAEADAALDGALAADERLRLSPAHHATKRGGGLPPPLEWRSGLWHVVPGRDLDLMASGQPPEPLEPPPDSDDWRYVVLGGRSGCEEAVEWHQVVAAVEGYPGAAYLAFRDSTLAHACMAGYQMAIGTSVGALVMPPANEQDNPAGWSIKPLVDHRRSMLGDGRLLLSKADRRLPLAEQRRVLRAMAADEVLLRWVNFHVERAPPPAPQGLRIENFGADMGDGTVLGVLLWMLAPEKVGLGHINEIDRELVVNAMLDDAEEHFGVPEGLVNVDDIKSGNRPDVTLLLVAHLFEHYHMLANEDGGHIVDDLHTRVLAAEEAVARELAKGGDGSVERYMSALQQLEGAVEEVEADILAGQALLEELTAGARSLSTRAVAGQLTGNEDVRMGLSATRQDAQYRSLEESRVADILGGSKGEREENLADLNDVMRAHYMTLKRVYRHYAGGGHMRMHAFGDFLKDCKIRDRNFSRAQANLVFTKVNWDDDSFGGDSKLDPREFVEAIARLANDKFRTGSVADRLEKLMLENIIPYACMSQAEEFREIIYQPPMKKVFRKYAEHVRMIYCFYAEQDTSTATAMDALDSLNMEELTRLLKDAGLLGGASTISVHSVAIIFGNVQQDDLLLELNYNEFLEAMVVMAIYKDPNPFKPLHIRVSEFFDSHLIKPLMGKVPHLKSAKVATEGDLNKEEGGPRTGRMSRRSSNVVRM